MKYLVCLVTILFCLTDGMAKGGSKRLYTYVSNQGSVYFIRNKKLKEHSQQIHKFEFDVTQVTGRDSATLNFTVVTDKANDITSLSLGNGEVKTTCSRVALLYHDIKGSRYEIRTTAQVCYADLKRLYSSSLPVTFDFADTDGTHHTATYTASQWKKEEAEFAKIFFLINK